MANYQLQGSLLEACSCAAPCPCWIWHGGDTRWAAFGLGVRHAIFCVGCCWALMLVMFAVGGVNLGWMLVLGVVMFAEKAVGWGRRITAPVGAGLALWGLLLLAGLPGPLRP